MQQQTGWVSQEAPMGIASKIPEKASSGPQPPAQQQGPGPGSASAGRTSCVSAGPPDPQRQPQAWAKGVATTEMIKIAIAARIFGNFRTETGLMALSLKTSHQNLAKTNDAFCENQGNFKKR
jgi:hypothetical protein